MTRAEEPALRRALGFVETAALSVAMMAPTAAMAVNAALAAATVGAATPLAFVFAFALVCLVAYAFVIFAQTYASAGSVYAFVERAFGARAGALAAWGLVLTYLCFTAGSFAEAGAFARAAFAYGGFDVPWAPVALACAAGAAVVGIGTARLAGRAMLALEVASLAAIVALSVAILARGGAHGLSLEPFSFAHVAPGGIGLAAIFALLSFAGFEGAAVLGAESHEPTKTIPRALVTSVAVTGVAYTAIAYAQTVGFGIDADGISAFAKSQSPLGDLASRYAGRGFAIVVSLAATLSGFAAGLASATGAARLLYALAYDGCLPRAFAAVAPASGTPARAFLFAIGVGVAGVVGCALAGWSGIDAFAAFGAVGVLALVVVYAAVQIAALRLFARGTRDRARIVIPVLAFTALLACFVANVVPLPTGIALAYPFVALAWFGAGAIFLTR
jgi:amino acid transporter